MNHSLNVAASVVLVSLVAYYLFREEQSTEVKTCPEGGLHLSNEEKEMFIPTNEWQPVGDDHICPAGLEYKLNVYDGTKFARLVQ